MRVRDYQMIFLDKLFYEPKHPYTHGLLASIPRLDRSEGTRLAAIPGVVPAVEIDGQPLVDGGVVAEVPSNAAREVGWPVVAVDVSMDVPPLSNDDLVLDTMMRTQMMTARLLRQRQLRSADLVIRPDVGNARWAEWQRFDEFVELGRVATREFLGL